MSTITVVRRKNEVAIAADTLTSTSSRGRESAEYVVNHEKIFPVGESFLALAGPAVTNLAVRECFANWKKTPALNSVEEIYRTWLKLHFALKEEHFLRPDEDDEDPFESTRVDTLIANPNGIFGISTERQVQEYSKFFAVGSGDEYALGAMFVAYQDESKSAEEVARLGVNAAIEFNTTSGAPVTSRTIRLK